MPVICSHCGEELLGAVNRCWKCGKTFALRPERDGQPPLRRPPVVESIAADSPPVEVVVVEASGVEAPTNIRRGSPFVASASLSPAPRAATVASGAAAPPSAAPAALDPNYSDRYAEHVVSIVAAVMSVLLGLASLALCGYFPIGALVVAVVGLAMGVWGLYSERRIVAVIGLILCCIALSIGGFRCVVQLYTNIYGFSPWQRDDEIDPLGDSMNEGE